MNVYRMEQGLEKTLSRWGMESIAEVQLVSKESRQVHKQASRKVLLKIEIGVKSFVD